MTLKITTKVWMTPEEIRIMRPVVKHMKRLYPQAEIRLTKTGFWFVDAYRDQIAGELREFPQVGWYHFRSRLADWIATPTAAADAPGAKIRRVPFGESKVTPDSV